ncbi:MAG: O-antigen ligase family protein [Flavobacteriales bacterium]|nr:O-antigen ligase family protein [Flavobacteriales bacterium]
MSKLNQYLSRGIHFSILFIAISFPLPYKVSNLGIVALLVFWIIQKIVTKRKPSFNFESRYEKWIFFSFLGFFVWQIISLFYTTDISYGIKNVESKLSLLIFPLILFDLRPSYQQFLFWLKAYVYSMALCTIVLLVQSISHYFTEGSLLTYHDFTSSLAFHAVFYSYYIFLSILITAFLFQKNELKNTEKFLLIISIVLSLVGLLISASKNVLVVTSFFLIIGFLIRAIKQKVGWKEVSIVLLIGVVSVFGISKVPAVKNRIAELAQLNGMENLEKIKRGELIVAEDIPKFNGTSMRITFWYVVVNKMLDEGTMILGYSPGDRRAIINKEFYKNGLNPWYENYNIHNQFVQVLAELGLIGLGLYIMLHFSFLMAAIEKKNFLLAAFLIGFVIFQMTESIIERNKGIVFFIFFLLLLLQLKPYLNEDRDTRN